MKKAIVTGATGFIGSNLCKYLIKNNYEVSIVSRPTSNYENLDSILNKVKVFEFEDNLDSLIDFFKEAKADVVFHLAAVAVNQHKTQDIDRLLDGNIKFGLYILEAMKQTDVPFIINTGTYWQHFESDEYNPLNLYAATKQSFQDLIKYYTSAEDIKAITLKLFDTYGPLDNRPKLLNLLYDSANKGEPLDMSPGEQYVDLVYIDDIVKAFVKAHEYISNIEEYEEFAVATGELITLKELVKSFEIELGKEIKVNWGGLNYREREVMKPWNKYKTLPNWKCDISLKQGLSKF